MTQDQLSIVVIDVQVGEYESILFNHPEKHFWLVTLTQDDACDRWIVSCVCGHEKSHMCWLVSQHQVDSLLTP